MPEPPPAPGMADAPDTLGAFGTPDAPGTLGTPEAPGTPDALRVFGSPDALGVFGMADTLGKPEAPEASGAHGTPGAMPAVILAATSGDRPPATARPILASARSLAHGSLPARASPEREAGNVTFTVSLKGQQFCSEHSSMDTRT